MDHCSIHSVYVASCVNCIEASLLHEPSTTVLATPEVAPVPIDLEQLLEGAKTQAEGDAQS